MTKMGRACSTHGTIQKCLQNLVGRPEGKETLRRLRGRWEDNIEVDLRKGVVLLETG